MSEAEEERNAIENRRQRRREGGRRKPREQQHARSRGSSCSRAGPSSWLCHPRGGKAAGRVGTTLRLRSGQAVRAVAPARNLEFIPHDKSQAPCSEPRNDTRIFQMHPSANQARV